MATLELVITNACNLRCKYCFESNFSSKDANMPLNVAKASIELIINQAQKKGDTEITVFFFGGEPLLRIDFIKKVIEIIEKEYNSENEFNFHYSISTNGILLNAEIVDYFLSKNMILQVSIDGIPEIQDQNRVFPDGSGSSIYFDTIFRHTTTFAQNGIIKPTIKMVIDPSNVARMYDNIVFLAKEKHIVSFDINYEGEWTNDAFNIFCLQFEKTVQNYSEILKKQSSVKEIEDMVSRLQNMGNFPVRDCGAGRTYIAVKPNGNLFPCSRFAGSPEYCMGNVFTGFNNTENTKSIQACSIDQYACKVKSCKLFPFCNCRCLYLNQFFTGSHLAPGDLQCLFRRAILNYIMRYFFAK